MARRSYTRETKEAVLAAYPDLGAAECSRQWGIPKPTVISWAQRSGVRSHAAETLNAGAATRAAGFAERRAALADRLLEIAEMATQVERDLLERSKLYEVVGARTRAIHDHQLLVGDVTNRTEVRHLDHMDAEIEALAHEMAE